MTNRNISEIKRSTRYLDPAMFSLVESEAHYFVAVDLPAIPTHGAEILTAKGELTVEGQSEISHDKQTIFRMFPQGRGIKTVYMNGILYLVLPKRKMKMHTPEREVATA